MAKYKHVLFATDLSPDSSEVAVRTKNISKQNNCKLSILHVIQPLSFYAGGEFGIPLNMSVNDGHIELARRELARQAQELDIDEENRWLELGMTQKTIVDLVGKLKVDLVIIGSHDHHGLGLFFGSTADSILHAVPCDILAVRLH